MLWKYLGIRLNNSNNDLILDIDLIFQVLQDVRWEIYLFVDLQRKRIVIILSYDHPHNDCNPAPDVSQGSRTQNVFPTSSSWNKPKPQPTDLQIKIWQKFVDHWWASPLVKIYWLLIGRARVTRTNSQIKLNQINFSPILFVCLGIDQTKSTQSEQNKLIKTKSVEEGRKMKHVLPSLISFQCASKR